MEYVAYELGLIEFGKWFTSLPAGRLLKKTTLISYSFDLLNHSLGIEFLATAQTDGFLWLADLPPIDSTMVRLLVFQKC
jgi:hypothetical protein